MASDARAVGSEVLDPRREEPLDDLDKGLSSVFFGLRASEVGRAGVHLFDGRIHFPAAVLRRSALEANRAWMRRYLEATGARIAPHGKTTMAPRLFAMQMADGAWGLTAATVAQVRAYRRFGLRRILLANPLVGPGEIDWALQALDADKGFELLAFADRPAHVQAAAERAAVLGAERRIRLLVEVGRRGGRAGVRSLQDGLAVARAAAAAPGGVELAGVAAYEGVFQSAPDGAADAGGMLDLALETAAAMEQAGLLHRPPVVSIGGSGFYDLVRSAAGQARLAAAEVILRPGCYLTHDDGLYARLFEAAAARSPDLARLPGALRPALQVWGHVLSRPEPGLLVCGVGKRDLGADAGPPRLAAWARLGDGEARPSPDGLEVRALFDQHLVLTAPEDAPLQPGDLAGFGVSHPCTTFDKWRVLLMLDDAGRVEEAVRTYF